MFTEQDLNDLNERGISLEQIETQLNCFREGFPYLKIMAPASIGRGIIRLDEAGQKHYLDRWSRFLEGDRVITKFVPASGAASRMFKDLFAFLNGAEELPTTDFERRFFGAIRRFAFFDALNKKCVALYGKEVDALCGAKRYKEVVAALLKEKGLNYGNLPKGLLLFHRYPEGERTPMEEHLTEGALYAGNATGTVRLHFTVSKEHLPLFQALFDAKKTLYEQKSNRSFSVSYSIQKPSTDTIAVDLNNLPFREEEGALLFRPGGHGALIENLNDIDSDVIFIKNIDNVVPDRLKEDEATYKRLLGGILVEMQQRAFDYLRKLDEGTADAATLAEMERFLAWELSIESPASFASEAALKDYLRKKLDRPFRVCGMVKNVGEPGGGPFIAVNPDGTASPQILESSQIDKNDARAMNAFRNGSHFNPVDVVCGVKDYRGNKYDLTQYVDRETGFISQKSKNGRELKALELPGLWNGAMSDWNTIFAEVPISTFNPVKTVNDLLRPEHQ